jgi:hypothetical protein
LKESAFGELPKHKGKRAFVPGNVAESYAYQRMIATEPTERMPPPTSHLKLDAHEKELIKQWIEEGAEWQEHWGFVAPVRPEVPKVGESAKGQANDGGALAGVGGWARNEIDAFVLAKLEGEGLKPSGEADRATLIRRVSLDLTGLPPTVAEVEAFEKDTAPGAYERVVDRLLASPRYGEHMAASWLDEARYADSHGYQSDPERHQWHWRDWVIGAFNRNMPYDRFVVEQIAGDLLPNATEEQRVATGFNRNHRQNSEGGIIDEEWRVETVIDRVETTSGSILGLTMGCARCHDHKYDPMTQKEMYQFAAYFNSINERGEYFSVGLDRGINGVPIMKVLAAPEKERIAKLKGEMAAEEGKIAAMQAKLPEYEKRYKEEGSKAPEPAGLALRFALDGVADGVTGEGAATEQAVPPPARPFDVFEAERKKAAASKPTTGAAVAAAATKPAPAKKKLTVVTVAATRPAAGTVVGATFEAKDGSNYAEGKVGKGIKFDGKGTAAVDVGQAIQFERGDAFSYGAWVNLQGGDGAVLSKMNAAPSHRGIDLLVAGGRVMPHVVTKWPENALKVSTVNAVPLNQWVHLMVTYDGTGKALGLKVYVNGVPQATTTDVDNLRGTIRSGSPLLIGKRVDGQALNGTVDDVRFYSRVLTRDEVVRLAVGPDLEMLVKVEPEKRTKEQQDQLASALLGPLAEYGEAVTARDKAKAGIDAIENDPRNTTMVMEELPKPRDTFVLIRGLYDHRGEKVEPGVPAMLNELPAGVPQNRLGLAQWMVSPENPLTARVRVNRLWEQLFGVGLVKTSENFGIQAEWPSHPELLDWLATEFVARKWDVKGMQKLMVTSAAYRQSSNVTPGLVERDPENRLLARGPRFRLTAEQVRDQALAVSGLLSGKIGGPSVRPYQPADLWAGNLFGNLVKYEEGKGEDLYRRTVYTFLKRTAAPANQMVWDMPSREFCLVKRSRTNTPLQALNVMNDPTYVEASRVLAEKMIKEGGKDAGERIRYAFRKATCRVPTEGEMRILERALAEQVGHYKKDVAGAAKLIAVGAMPADAKLDPSELAAYTMTASVILNLDEIVNKN